MDHLVQEGRREKKASVDLRVKQDLQAHQARLAKALDMTQLLSQLCLVKETLKVQIH